MSFGVLETAIFSVFNSSNWKAENIKTYPDNFIELNSGNEFIRVSIIPSGNSLNLKSKSGLLLIDIFTSAGNGPKRSTEIADKLDTYFIGKNILSGNYSLQFPTGSSLGQGKQDSANPSLYRVTYSIPFNLIGVH